MPRTIALTYLAFGAIWIFCTDRLLARMDVGAALMLQIQTYKGWSYVLVSAFLLYLLLRRQQQRDRAGMAALLQSQLQSQEKVRRMNADLEQRVAERTLQLATANNELESFAYAVSHDLRAPLRSMSGFSQILRDSAPAGLDQQSLHYLQRIQEASERMSSLIDDLLGLSRINRSELARRPVSLTRIAEEAAAAIRERHPERDVRLQIAPEMNVDADARLLRIALENLLSNAWKYTARTPAPQVIVGVQEEESGTTYFVRDNGIGFDMAYADKLFVPFQRLHADSEFPGTGIGLVTVQRILARHGGRIWARGEPGQGATFYFTLGS